MTERHVSGWRTVWFAAAIIAVMAVAALRLGEPLVSSHSFRQAHTAQMAESYLIQEWNPALSTYWFNGRPGVNVLEFPVYQNLVAAVSWITRLPTDISGKLVNFACALLLVLGCLRFAEQWWNLEADRSRRLQIFLFGFTTPLVMGMSLWVIPDVLMVCCAAWSLHFGTRFLREPTLRCGHGTALLLLTALSGAIKPSGLVVAAPFFAVELLEAWKQRRKKTAAAFMALCVLAAAIAAGWFYFGQVFNTKHAGHYRISDGQYFQVTSSLFQAGIAHLAPRIVIYLIGPLGLLLGAAFFKAARFRFSSGTLKYEVRFCVPVFSGILYLAAFFGLNLRHNYYQLPLFIPVFLFLYAGTAILSETRARWLWVIGTVGMALNLLVADQRLLKPEPGWKSALQYLNKRVSRGLALPDLDLCANHPAASPIVSYYLERYVTRNAHLTNPALDSLYVCSPGAGEQACRARAASESPECSRNGEFVEGIWICFRAARQ